MLIYYDFVPYDLTEPANTIYTSYLSGERKVWEKRLNYFQVTKFFPNEIFSWLSFSRTVFFPDFFSLDKEFIPIFFRLLLLLLFPIYLQNFLLSCFFWCTLFIVVDQSSFKKKKSKCEWKQGIEKNNNNNDVNITRNCKFVNFKNYTTLNTSKRICFKLVLIISRSKERVLNSCKDFVWFFDRWFKAEIIQNHSKSINQIQNLIDLKKTVPA